MNAPARSHAASKWLAVCCVLIGLTACPEKSAMTTTAQPAIVLASPPGTETIVLGMGCFWGAEQSYLS